MKTGDHICLQKIRTNFFCHSCQTFLKGFVFRQRHTYFATIAVTLAVLPTIKTGNPVSRSYVVMCAAKKDFVSFKVVPKMIVSSANRRKIRFPALNAILECRIIVFLIFKFFIRTSRVLGLGK